MSDKLIVSSSPHVGIGLTTKKIMLYVIIALIPPLAAGVVLYGFYALTVVAVSVASAVGAEALYNLIAKKKQTLGDLSAVVTGLILGLNMPPRIPLFMPIIGSIFAIAVVKMLFGGLGKNFANPAATGRVFVLLAWTSAMTTSFKNYATYIKPLDYSEGFAKAFFSGFSGGELTTHATPLAFIKNSASTGVLNGDFSLLDLFLGRTGGSIGETCVLAIIIGAAFLLALKIIDWKIPVVYVGISALFCLIFYKNGYNFILPNLMSGGLMFAAVYMLTDYSSSPNTRLGTVIFAAGAAFMTMLIRRYGGYNEGASIAILFMNCLVPLIDKLCRPKPYGYVNPKTKEASGGEK